MNEVIDKVKKLRLWYCNANMIDELSVILPRALNVHKLSLSHGNEVISRSHRGLLPSLYQLA